MDNALTASIQQWVNTAPGERSVQEGAALLLKFNRNQWLYRSACLFPRKYEGIIENELKKHLRIRLAGYTQREVAQMEAKVLPAVEAAIAEGAPAVSTEADFPEGKYRGRRADHDSLPDNIRQLYETNGEIYFKMKQLFETLKGMEKAEPCDRFEYTGQLRDLHTAYCRNWEKYDTYRAGDASIADEEASDGSTDISATDAGAAVRALSAARRWISEWVRRIPDIEDDTVRAERLEELQNRVRTVAASGGTFKPDLAALIRELGVEVPVT